MKLHVIILMAMIAVATSAQEAENTITVTLDFNKNPWSYPVTEVTSKWYPDYTDLDSPGAILNEKDFSWPISEGSSLKVKVTVYPVDLDEYSKVSVYASCSLKDAEVAGLGVNAGKTNMLYTQPGTTMRFEAPTGYKFDKMVFYNYRNANFLVGDEYEEEFEYEYNSSVFKQKLKVWTPASPKKNTYEYDIWQGDDTNILFNYPYFSAVFVKVDIRLVPSEIEGIKLGNFYYYFSGENASIVGYDANTLSEKLTIPSSVEYKGLTYNITSISDSAFYQCDKITSLEIPEGCTNIGKRAFSECTNLINLNCGAKAIDASAFAGCNRLETATLSNVNSIAKQAFENCSALKWVDFGTRLSSIESKSFGQCASLTYLVFPSTLSIIASDSFVGCTFVQDVIYLGNYEAIGLNDVKTYTPSDLIKFSQKEFTYDGVSPIISYKNNIIANFAPYDVKIPVLEKDAGTYSIDIPFKFRNSDMSFDTDITYCYTISPASLKAKVADVSREYGEENPKWQVNYYGFVNGEDEDVITTKPTISTTAGKKSDVGTYPITIDNAKAQNYIFEYEEGILTIYKAPLIIQVKDTTRLYGDANPIFKLKYTGLKNDELSPTWIQSPVYYTEVTSVSNVGTYDISVKCEPRNYDANIQSGKITVTKAPLIIRAKNAQRLYYEDNPEFGYTCIGFKNEDDESVLISQPLLSTDAIKTSPVGFYSIIPRDAIATNYNLEYMNGLLSVLKRELIIKPVDASRKYGDANPKFSLEYKGFVNNEDETVLSVIPSLLTTATAYSNVGTYSITISEDPKAENYTITCKTGELTVTKAPLTAKVMNATKIYGYDNPAFTIKYSGLKNDEIVPTWSDYSVFPIIQTVASRYSDVGEYTISATCPSAINYDISEIEDGVLTVEPAEATIKVSDVSRLYYDENPQFQYIITNINNGLTPTFETEPVIITTATKTSGVGSYEITASGAFVKNYTLNYIPATLTVVPCTLTVSVDNYERLFNEDNPIFKVRYDGYVGNEDENVLLEKAIAATTATKTSDVGTYPIIISGGNANNYVFSYINGLLIINKADQIITWEQDLAKLKVGDQIELKATASSGLTVAYTSDNPSIAEVYAVGNKYYLDCKAEGELWLVAVQNGNQNYYSSPRIRKNIMIGDGSAINSNTRTIARIEKTTYGIRVIDANMGEMVYVYTTGGQLIHSVKAAERIIDISLAKEGVYIVKVGGKTVKLGY